MKRLAVVLMVCCLLSGCVRTSTTPTPTNPPEPPAAYADNHAYIHLSTTQQENYGAVYTAVEKGFGVDSSVTVATQNGTQHRLDNGVSIELPHPLGTEKELRELYNAFMQDNPQFFHVGSVYGYDGRQHGEERRITALKLTYTMTAEERLTASTALEQQVQQMLGALTSSMTAFEKELALHDALCARCTYDTDTAAGNDPLRTAPHAFTVYGALVEGKAVCEGYARAMQYLLNRAGIEATVVSGSDSAGHAHLWNAVRLDGDWYYLDATWNDTEEIPTYTYFNLNTAEIERTHTFDDTMPRLENTTATTYNYYQQTHSHLTTLRLDEIATYIADRLAAGDNTVHMRFSEEAFTNALLFVRSASWLTDTVNAYLPPDMMPLAAVTVVCDEQQRTVTISKKTS